MVTLADGSTRAIEQIRVKDSVLAWNEKTKQLESAEVEQTFVHAAIEGTVIVNGTLVATPNHPFYAGGRWVRADELKVGDELVALPQTGRGVALGTQSGHVTSLTTTGSVNTVYNLEVKGVHTYFAGGILVHNKPAK
jgi:hypothetical protein